MNDRQLRQFKNILKDYTFYEKQIQEMRIEIDYLYEVASGYKGVKYDNLRYARKEDGNAAIFEKIEKIKKRKQAYEYLIESADSILSSMTEQNREAVIKIYIKGESYEKVAQELHFSNAGIFKAIHRELRKM